MKQTKTFQIFTNILYRILTVWNIFTTIEYQSDQKRPLKECLLFFPIVGALLGGLILAFIVATINLSGVPAATILTAILLPCFLFYINSGRQIKSLLSLAEPVFFEYFNKKNETEKFTLYCTVTFMVLLLIFKLLAVGVFVFSAKLNWLFLLPIVTTTAFAELLILFGAIEEASLKNKRYLHWIIAFIFAGWVLALPGVITVVVVWFVLNRTFYFLKNKYGNLSENMIYAMCELIELAVLLAGIFLLQKI
ncbi:MAG: hypothetical protein U9O87_01335 [Verrucomicrobiota bacterium]|nr:hypothetical protein [Verrucomicrobiota bacterium]